MTKKQIRNWIRGGAALACSAIVMGGTFVACSSSSNNTAGSNGDGGSDATADGHVDSGSGNDSASTRDTGSTGDTGGNGDTGTGDTGTGSETGSETGSDAGADVTDGGGGPPAPLALCPLLDAVFACGGNAAIPSGMCVQADAANVGTDRLDSWGSYVQDNFMAVVFSDCRVAGTQAAATTADNLSLWLNELPNYATQLFGCPVDSDGGALSYQLPPPEVTNHTYTTADLNAFTEDFIIAVEQVLAGQGDSFDPASLASPPPNTEPDGGPFSLTPSQKSNLDAWLVYLQSKTGPATSTNYTFKVSADSGTCTLPDGG
jgi:hypothetical protein